MNDHEDSLTNHPTDIAYRAGREFAKGWTNAAASEFDDIDRKAEKESEKYDDEEAFLEGYYEELGQHGL